MASRIELRGALGLVGLLAGLTVFSQPASGAPRAATRAATPAAKGPVVLRMPLVRASDPSWIGPGQLAFLGNRVAGAPVDVFIWEPLPNKIGRATTAEAVRHGLSAASDGRLAYVERGQMSAALQAGAALGLDRDWIKPGPDSLVVYDFLKTSRKPIFEGGWVLPGALSWSPDGRRIAFLLVDKTERPRLGLIESGKPLAITKLDATPELAALTLHSMVGWTNDREVLLGASAGNGAVDLLLAVGKDGIRSLPGAITPRLSPDGRMLLAKATLQNGVVLRGMAGGARMLHQTAESFAWTPRNDRILVSSATDVLLLDLQGRVLRQYIGAAASTITRMVPSPDGRYVAVIADAQLTVLVL